METVAARVICVGSDTARVHRWASWLAAQGYETGTCAGYEATEGCPRLEGRPCEIREWADVAVLDVSRDSVFQLSSGRTVVCSRLEDDGRAVIVHGAELS